MTIIELQKQSHETAKDKGWHEKDRNIGEMIALCHSELSEALEEARKSKLNGVKHDPVSGKPVGFAIELADCIIRIADMAEYMGINLTEAIETKMEYNKVRSYRHGNKLF